MRINNINFTGYDARKLDGFVMTSNYGNVANAMTQIGQIEGFNIYFSNYTNSDTFEITQNKKLEEENFPPLEYTQDAMGIRKNKLLTSFEDDRIIDTVKHHFDLKRDRQEVQARKQHPIHEIKAKLSELLNLPTQTINGEKVYFYTDANTKKTIPMGEDEFITKFATNKNALETMLDKTHIRGGNYFITKNKSGEDELIIGADELKKFDKDQIKHMFSVQTVRVIPQMDKDLDLFIRPLNNGRILIADDNMTKQTIKEGLKKTLKSAHEQATMGNYATLELLRRSYTTLSTMLSAFDNVVAANRYAQTDETAKVLEDAGYEVIRVPGRLYSPDNDNPNKLTQFFNFMNANVLLNKDNELVYITNDSIFDRVTLGITKDIEKLTGFSMQKSFLDALKKQVGPIRIYTIAGNNNSITDTLVNDSKGIHSMCAEVPEKE